MAYYVEASDGSGFGRNGLVFRTHKAAVLYARDLMSRWLACTETRIVETDEVPTTDATVEQWEAKACRS